ncbi:MAG: hypothetical protein HN948_09505 [Clostridia bacterium]|jgi:uroporphyrinogen decarboxylase|nr:hypothetical protein [Clostridia bacterium]MBT7123228.1 hypothetical protein [Clostridia bacterium]
MTSRDKVTSLISGSNVSPIPYNFNMTQKMQDKMAAYYKQDAEFIEDYIGNCFLYISPQAHEDFEIIVKDNAYVDEFGIKLDTVGSYHIGEFGVLEQPLKGKSAVGDYKYPDFRAGNRYRNVESKIKQHPNRYVLFRTVGLFDNTWHVTGFEDLLMEMGADSPYSSRMLDMSMDYIMAQIETLPDYINGVRFLEDWGHQAALLMSPDMWRKKLKPRLKIIYNEVKRKGKTLFSHSCGDTTQIIPDLIEMGVDCIDPMQPEILDMDYIIGEYGKDVAFFGALGCQSTIPLGSPGDVVREAQTRIEQFSRNNARYIMGPAGSIPNEAPEENVAALVEFCKNM